MSGYDLKKEYLIVFFLSEIIFILTNSVGLHSL